MLEEMPYHEWRDWLQVFEEDPWDERRKDDRNIVAVMWGLSPHISDSDYEPPGFYGPDYSAEKERSTQLDESIARIEALKKKRQLNGQLDSKTRDHADH